MRKVFFMLVIVLAVTAALSAQSYTVQSVTGRVQREAGNSRVDVAVGDVLSGDTIIHTGIGASLSLKEGERTLTIPAGQNGRRVADLVASGSGIRIGGNVALANSGAVNRTTGQVSTASARASDAAEEENVAAE